MKQINLNELLKNNSSQFSKQAKLILSLIIKYNLTVTQVSKELNLPENSVQELYNKGVSKLNSLLQTSKS